MPVSLPLVDEPVVDLFQLQASFFNKLCLIVFLQYQPLKWYHLSLGIRICTHDTLETTYFLLLSLLISQELI